MSSDKDYEWKFKPGDKVRMIKPPVHGPKTREAFENEYYDYNEDEIEERLMKVGEVYTVDGDMWHVKDIPNILVRPCNGHCQPEECFVPFKLSNEERIELRRTKCKHSE